MTPAWRTVDMYSTDIAGRNAVVLEKAAELFSAPNQALSAESATPASGSHSPAKEEQPGKRGSSREDPSPRREQARLSDLAVLHVPFVRASPTRQEARREAKSLERTSAAQAEVSKVRRPLSTEGAPASPSRSRASTPGGLNSLYGGGRRAATGMLTVRPKERVSGGFWNTAGRLEALTAPLSPRARSRKMAFQQLLAGDDAGALERVVGAEV
eukprot:s1041_g10.t1